MSNNTDESIQVGNMVRVTTPVALTLTGAPANSVAFKVVRKDSAAEAGGNTPSATRRVRRSAANPILRIAFTDLGNDEIATILKDFGMDDYTISADDGVVVATRSDLLQSFAKENTEQVRLMRGVTAYVEKPAAKIQRADKTKQLRLTSIEFDTKRFDLASANEWLTAHKIDIPAEAVENPVAAVVAVRSDVAEGVEVRRMEIEDGVIAVLILDDIFDIPGDVVEVISTAAYGNWGWGQLDFNARLADATFCDAMSDGIWILYDTLYSLIFYSDLPLDVRQKLIANALSQYNDYVAASMSVLPRQVLVAVSRTDTRKEKTPVNTPVANTTAAQEPVARTDATTAAAPVVAAAAPVALDPNEQLTLTRADLEAQIEAEVLKRSGAAPANEGAALAVEPAATTKSEPTLGDLITRMDAMQTSLTSVVAANAAREAGAVVIRSEGAQGEDKPVVAADKDGKQNVSIDRKDPFKGVLGRIAKS